MPSILINLWNEEIIENNTSEEKENDRNTNGIVE